MQDLRQTPQYAQYMKSLGWKAISDLRFRIYIRKFPLIGIVAKLQRPEGKIDLDKIVKENRISILYFEPPLNTQYVIPNTLSEAKEAFLPPKTIIIDLTKSENELLKQMKPKTRYNIKVAQKRGVKVKESQDIEEFIKLWHKTSKDWGNWLPQKKEILGLFKHFKNDAKLLFAHQNKQLIGGLLIICSKDTAFYMYVGSTKKGKEIFAPTLLAWEGIKLSKKIKKKFFDFEGIYDERYPKQTQNWKGFTKFKEGFGGKVVEFPQTLVYYKNPIFKLLNI